MEKKEAQNIEIRKITKSNILEVIEALQGESVTPAIYDSEQKEIAMIRMQEWSFDKVVS